MLWAPAAGMYTYQLPAPLAPGAHQTVIFAVQVDNPLPSGHTSIDNMVTASDDGAHGPDLTPAEAACRSVRSR